MQTNTKDMETKSIPKLLAQLAIPSVVAQIVNLLYNIVDRIYIGHIPEIGASALTGVGLFMPILLLINAFAMGLRWEDVHLSKQYAEIKRAVTYPKKNQPVIKGTKTKKSVRTVILPKALVGILTPCAESEGFICGGEQPWTWTVLDNIKRRAYKKLKIKGFSNYDFRSTFGTQLKESGLSSAIVADLMGHADTRMVETVYARTRHEGVMKQLEAVEAINSGITAGL